MTFHMDQGQHMLESYQMWTEKRPRLIGAPIISRSFEGRFFYIGPYYYYVLAGLGLITNWNPITITQIILLIEWISMMILSLWIYNKYGEWAGLGVFLFVTTNNFLIIHSRFIWNPHFLLPLGVAGVIFLERYKDKNRVKDLFVFGFIWGLAFSFHQTAVLWLIPSLMVLREKLFKLTNILILGMAFISGDILYFIFEIKHNFYNFRTMWLVLTQSNAKGQIEPHHIVFPLIVFALWGVGYLIKKSKMTLGILVLINIASLVLIKYKIPLGHPEGWTYTVSTELVERILENGCPKDFNIASTLTGDTRSYDLRYLLAIKGCPPMGMEEYPKSKILYLAAPIDRPVETEKVWEVESFRPFKITDKQIINNRVVFYKLAKEVI